VGWIPELSLVAVEDDEVVGHVVCTRGDVDGRLRGRFAYAEPFSLL
jgi:predicted N-acetyltransferase YhbS